MESRHTILVLILASLTITPMLAQEFERMWTTEQDKAAPVIYSYDGSILARQDTDTTVVLLDSLSGLPSDTLEIPVLEGGYAKLWLGHRVSVYGRQLITVTLKELPEDQEAYFHVRHLDRHTGSLSEPVIELRAHTYYDLNNDIAYQFRFHRTPSKHYLLYSVLENITNQGITRSTGGTSFYDTRLDSNYDVGGQSSHVGVSGDGDAFMISSSALERGTPSQYPVDSYYAHRFSDGSSSRLFRNSEPDWEGRVVYKSFPLGSHGPVVFQDTVGRYPRPHAPWRVASFPLGWRYNVGDGYPIDSTINVVAAYQGARYVVAVDRTDLGGFCEVILYDVAAGARRGVIDTVEFEQRNDIVGYAHPSMGVLFLEGDSWLTRYSAPQTSATDTMWVDVSDDSVRIYESVTIQPHIFISQLYSHVRMSWGDSTVVISPREWRADGTTWKLTSKTAQSHKVILEVSDTTTGWSMTSEGPIVKFENPKGVVFVERIADNGIASLRTDGRYVSTTACPSPFDPWGSPAPWNGLSMRLDTLISESDSLYFKAVLDSGKAVFAIDGDSCVLVNLEGYGRPPNPWDDGDGSRFKVERAAVADTSGRTLWQDSTENYGYDHPNHEFQVKRLYERAYSFAYNEANDAWIAVMGNTPSLKKGYYYNDTLSDKPFADDAFLALMRRSGPDSLRQMRLLEDHVYSVDASFGDKIVAAREDRVFVYDLTTGDSTSLVESWTGTPLYDAIQIDSNLLLTNAGTFSRSSGWSMNRAWFFKDGRDVGRISQRLSFVLRSNRDTVGCIVDHYTGKIVQWLGQSVGIPRVADYDSIHHLVMVGDSMGIITGYDIKRVVSVTDSAQPIASNVQILFSESDGTMLVSAESPIEKVNVFNLTGQQVQVAVISMGETTRRLNLDDLVPGLYLVRVRIGEKWFTRKLVVR